MAMDKTVGLRQGDRLLLKKNHPCGSNVFCITRIGADVKLRCEGCGHVILLEREVLSSRLKKVLPLDQ